MNITDIPVIYINLERRPDRDKHIREELSKLGIHSPIRCNAVDTTNGAIGCSLSHIKSLKMAIEADYDMVLICEDDLEIVDTDACLRNINAFLKQTSIVWDVALIAGNNMIPYQYMNEQCIRVFNCYTTTGYIVRKSYYQTLLNHYREGVHKLIQNPENRAYCIDVYWQYRQKVDRWMMIIPPTIVQREDYSDIEHKVTNFRHYMLDINKAMR